MIGLHDSRQQTLVHDEPSNFGRLSLFLIPILYRRVYMQVVGETKGGELSSKMLLKL